MKACSRIFICNVVEFILGLLPVLTQPGEHCTGKRDCKKLPLITLSCNTHTVPHLVTSGHYFKQQFFVDINYPEKKQQLQIPFSLSFYTLQNLSLHFPVFFFSSLQSRSTGSLCFPASCGQVKSALALQFFWLSVTLHTITKSPITFF